VRVILFLFSFLTLIASFWIMGQAFAYPENGFWIFTGGLLLSVVCLAVPFKWMRD
jgi:hypothetical protein